MCYLKICYWKCVIEKNEKNDLKICISSSIFFALLQIFINISTFTTKIN